MKRIFNLALVLSVVTFIISCGVQRPAPLSIELMSSSGMPYEQQGYIAVEAYSLHDVRVDWDVTPTGAHGVRIIAAPGHDYHCREAIAHEDIWIANSRNIEHDSYMHSLGFIFERHLGKLAPGRYAFCVKALMYNRTSAASLPVFVNLRGPGGMGAPFFF